MSGVAERLAAALADRYRIEREIGAGGMATVYVAEDLRHHRHVAVKVITWSTAGGPIVFRDGYDEFLFIKPPASDKLEVVANWGAEVLPRLQRSR